MNLPAKIDSILDAKTLNPLDLPGKLPFPPIFLSVELASYVGQRSPSSPPIETS